MRRRAKIDQNQPLIVRALRDAGCSVVSLAEIGNGCVDLLVGRDRKNFIMEIKDPSRKPSERKLSEDEQQFHSTWNGQIAVVETVEQAFKVVGL